MTRRTVRISRGHIIIVRHRQRDEDSGETVQPEERPSIEPWRRQATNVMYTTLKSTFTGNNSDADNVYAYFYVFGRYWLPNLAKFPENSNLKLKQVKVIQGHLSWCQTKAHMRLPIYH